MGKDKYTFTSLLPNKEVFYKELEKRCESDIDSVCQVGGLQTDLYRECWIKGFQYAGERIARILELSDKNTKNKVERRSYRGGKS